MTSEERDEYIEKFRRQEINTIITTNLLARGIDVPEITLVVNFDVPTLRMPDGSSGPDAPNYMHRIGRAGRFGVKGVALTLYDRDEDEENLQKIMETYGMQDKLKKLENIGELKKLVEEIDAEKNNL